MTVGAPYSPLTPFPSPACKGGEHNEKVTSLVDGPPV